MPSIVNGGTFIPLIPTAPAASESQSSFVITANTFFLSLWLMVREVNSVLSGIAIAALPAPPSAGDSDFAGLADTFDSDLPGMVAGVNTVISTFFLPCSPVSTLPATPSRGSDPTNFASESGAFLAALPTLRTELNAFINALNAYSPSAPLGTHIGWRVYISANNGDPTYVSLREAQLRAVSGGSSVTSGGTAFQGGPGTDAGSGAGAPWDGNTANSWTRTIGGGYGMYFGYLFASPTAIVELAIMSSGARAPTGFKLQYSDDTTTGSDGTWHDIFTAFESSWSLSTDQYRVWPQDFTGGKYKAYRWLFTADNGAAGAQLQEAELHATVGGSDITSVDGAFASVTNVNEEAFKAFDNDNTTDWGIAHSQLPAWVACSFPTPTAKPAEYALTSNSSNGTAWTFNSWTFQGSVDGATWTTLDTQTGITWSATPQTKTFAVP